MGAIDTIKDAFVLIQKTDNIELFRNLSALQQQVYDLVLENGVLKDEARRLREAAQVRADLKFRGNAYWLGDEGPFCSKCMDADGKLVRVHQASGYRPMCPICGTVVSDPNAEAPRPVPRASRNWLSR